MAPSIISFRMLPITTTPMANGVSFSLVAGATCAVYFNNTFADGSTPTLNINSTGAKSLKPISRDRTIWWTDTKYSTNHVYLSFVVYTGSIYYATDSYIYRYYSDSDS